MLVKMYVGSNCIKTAKRGKVIERVAIVETDCFDTNYITEGEGDLLMDGGSLALPTRFCPQPSRTDISRYCALEAHTTIELIIVIIIIDIRIG